MNKILLTNVLIVSTTFSCFSANAGPVNKSIEETKKGVGVGIGGTKKGVKEGVGGTKKGIKEAIGGTKKGFKTTGQAFKKIL